MLHPLPDLREYGISSTYGFLPSSLPLTRLPDPYYNKWEAIIANFQPLLLSRRLRGVLDCLPVLSTIGLEHEAEWRRAYSLLSFFAHGYIWGDETPLDRVPPSISIPLLETSSRLELPPVATYAGLCLWNFKPLFLDEDFANLENLACLNTFTGSLDESWFYLVSVAIEACGAPIIPLMLRAIDAARHEDTRTVTSCLGMFSERLTDLTAILQRMYENCDPHFFYHRIRPFLAGSKNMADAGLPHGVIYEDGSGTEQHRQYSGGSNAQSSLIQFFDIVLGIEHRPTGEKRDYVSELYRERHSCHNFIREMRMYMPGPHARFLSHVASVASIRQYVEDHAGDRKLCIAYDACLAMLSAFRDKHIAIVTRYIVIPSSEARAADKSRSLSPDVARKTVNLSIASLNRSGSREKHGQKGTGGTALIPFLKQARDETREPAVEEWAARFMKRTSRIEGSSDFFTEKHHEGIVVEGQDVEIKGLAGTWTIDADIGGICLY